MKVVGLITEYNPFHNGHKYHIEEAKRVTGADYAIAVMSGNFVQRGTPAVIDKYSRAEMALHNGVDLVLELPVCYATGSAEFFAHGAVSLLDKLGIVDFLCFGSECGNITLLDQTAQFLLYSPLSYDEQLNTLLRSGLSYPAARWKALQNTLELDGTTDTQAISSVLMEPNNILGIEYMKAIHNLGSAITPVTIQRIAAHYHDSNLADKTDSSHSYGLTSSLPQFDVSMVENLTISSATAIRKAIHSRNTDERAYFEEIQQSIPEDVLRILKNSHLKTYPVTEDDFSSLIKYKMLIETRQTLAEYMDVSEDLADRIKNFSDYNKSIDELAQEIKTKNLTLTRVNRAFIHMLLNIRKKDISKFNDSGYTNYARILGIKKESSHLLRKIEKCERIPIITKVSKADDLLDPTALAMLKQDITAAHLYNQIIFEKYGTTPLNEYKRGICIV